MSDYDSKIIRKQIRVYGSVFMEIQGTEEQIDRVFAMVSQGTYVNIEKMDAKSIPVVEDERGFHTRESLGDFWGLWHR